MKHKITFKNIKDYIEGNVNMVLDNAGLTADHLQEQYAYRILLCENDCKVTGQCVICNCDFPGRIYTSKSCNKERFSDLMSRLDWEEFKIKNNINE